MTWPTDHPAFVDPDLRPWAAGIHDVVPAAQVDTVLRYLPGRRVATLVEHEGQLAVVKVFASPRARGNVRRLRALAETGAAALVPTVIGSDATGHVLAVTFTPGILPASLSEAQYPACLARVGTALRRLHDSRTKLDRVWDWEKEVTQLRRRATAATMEVVETIVTSTSRLAGAALVPSHRDLHPLQVVVAADRSVSFIDLDDAAMGPRGLDIGNMLGHLVKERICGARSAPAAMLAGEAFLEGYGPCVDLDDSVLTGWTLLAVARLAGLAESRHRDIAQRDALLAHCHDDLERVGGVVANVAG
jgi:Ser/Thr protein kinase RdoA (MazF antagonist)